MPSGRVPKADPGTLHAFAHQFYWDFRRLDEGRSRLWFDRRHYDRFMAAPPDIGYSAHEMEKLEAKVEDEIQRCQLTQENLEKRLQELKREDSVGFLVFLATQEATKQIKVPGEPDVIQTLLSPNTTAEQIRELCKTSVMMRTVEIEPGVFREIEMLAWPLPAGSVFPTYLSQYAEKYIAALHDPRFPRCDTSIRPTNRLKQFWFLSRALAGALYGVATRTAINLVGSLRPEEIFQVSRDAKPQRRRRGAIKRKSQLR